MLAGIWGLFNFFNWSGFIYKESLMIKQFKNLVQSFVEQPDEYKSGEELLHLAAAVLLVEVMMADHEVRQEEIEQITNVLKEIFGIEKEQSTFLIQDAQKRHQELVSLQEMTSIINEQKDQELKRKIIFAMWCIAYADSDKDKYEEHLIRKVADLLYLSHVDFIKARHLAEKQNNKGRGVT
jgi:uncharacterized tellurite resistance protein B-like protein